MAASESKAMTESEMIEALADAEHASWARWMAYLFSKSPYNPAGHRVIPEGLVRRWQRQIDTPYADLTEEEQQSDRNEVAHILPIINARLTALLAERDAEIKELVEAGNKMNEALMTSAKVILDSCKKSVTVDQLRAYQAEAGSSMDAWRTAHRRGHDDSE